MFVYIYTIYIYIYIHYIYIYYTYIVNSINKDSIDTYWPIIIVSLVM